jgi:stage II sporulation protein D
VSDIDSTTGEPYCIYSPQFYWAATYSRFQLDEIFSVNLTTANPTYAYGVLGRDVTDIKVIDYFNSLRVDSLRIMTDNRNVYYVRGDRTRYLFRSSEGTLLRSSLFNIFVFRNNRGRIEKLVVKGQGSGHGVGMCQWGAIGMSRLGYNYLQILSHYYPGTEVKKVY